MQMTEKLKEWFSHPISRQEKFWYTTYGMATERFKKPLSEKLTFI